MFNYPLTAQDQAPATVANGDFQVGGFYKCVSVNPNAKAGPNGQPRFTVDNIYMCVANATSVTETDDTPPVFLIDNGFRAVNCGSDAKLKTKFVKVDS